MSRLRFALAQVTGDCDVRKNLEKARRFAARAAGAGAEIVVFPEMFMALPREGEPLGEAAEPADGPFAQALGGIAKEHGLFICAGLWESSPEPPLVYNLALVVSPSGGISAAYRKIHLFDALAVRESDRMLPGESPPAVFTAGAFTIGLAVCYDLRFPELFRSLSGQGADVMLVPAAWYAGPLKEDQWLTLLRARAIENVCYAAGAVLTGPPFAGRSAAFDPFGVPVADAGESEGIATFTAEKSRLDEVRAKLPALEHRRPDIFPGPPAGQ